jgi:hypothetical protein
MDSASPLTTGIPWLDRALAVLFALGAVCSLLSHVVQPDTKIGKLVSWAALNFGKRLAKPSSGSLTELPPPKGFARLATLALLAVVALAFSAAAQEMNVSAPLRVTVVNPEALKDAVVSDPSAVQPGADEAPPAVPQFGGCVKQGKVCFGPSVAMTLAALNLKTKTVEGAFSPGIGYGFTVNPGKWSSLGADAYFTLDPAAQRASAAVLLKFFNGYIRVGASKGIIGDVAWRIPFAFGLGF